MPKRLWIVSELYYPEDTSTGYFLTRIAEGLAQHYPVSVLCSQPTYSERGIRAPVREKRNGVNIQRCPGTTFNKDNLLFRLINLATISFSIFFMAVSQVSRHDYVLVVTNPPLLPFGITVACWLRGAKCLLLIHDVYPEALIASGMLRSGAFFARALQWLVKRLYCRVDRIIVLGRDMEKLVARKLEYSRQEIAIIPNWGDSDEIAPSPRTQNALLHELGLTDKFIIQFSGNMGRTHGLETLLESARRLRNTENIHFLFIGSGAKKRWLKETVETNGLQNVTILPRRPRSDLSNSLNACDVAIISFVPGMAGISVPSRMYNILAAGKPIIAVADHDSELALVVQEEQVGWVVPPGQSDRIVEVILEARANPDRLAEMGRRARAVAENKYSFQHVIEMYYALIRGLDDDSTH